MAKDSKKKKTHKEVKNPNIKAETKPEESNQAGPTMIVITETEEDVVLDSGLNGDPENLKNQIKKEAQKSDVLSRFLIPLFTFLFIGLIVGGLTWYYARPEVANQKSQEEKIETPPQVPQTTTPAQTQAQTGAPAAATPAQPTTYTVQSGDTLSSIANANGLTSKQLADYNSISNADSLTIGQVLKIPPK